MSDIPNTFIKPDAQNDYLKRVELVPMRDGVKLYTVIVVPKGIKDAPIILTRTPYDAKERVSNDNPAMTSLPLNLLTFIVDSSATRWEGGVYEYVCVCVCVCVCV